MSDSRLIRIGAVGALAVAGTAVLMVAGSGRPAVAAAVAAGFDPLTSVVDARTATSTDYVNSDGSHTSLISEDPVNYQDANGIWQPINTAVTADPSVSGGLEATGNSWQTHFGSTVQGLRVDLAGGSIGVVPVGAAMVEPVAGAATGSVSYPDAWPGADLTYTVLDDSVKEAVMLTSPSAATSYVFSIRAGSKSMVASDSPSTAVTLTSDSDGSGQLVPTGVLSKYVALQAPMVLDKNGAPIEQAQASLTATAPGQVTLSIDPVWLAAQPESAYPITLDPSVALAVDNSISYKSDGYTCTGCDEQSGNSRDLINGGTYDRYWRTIFHFPLNTIAGKTVSGASIYATKDAGASGAWPMNVYWANAFSYAGAQSGPVLASGAPGSANWLNDSGLSHDVAVWAAQGTNDPYLGVTGSETPGQYSYQKYTFQLAVTYLSTPNAPTGVAFSSPSVPCTTTAPYPHINTSYATSFGATFSTPDGGTMNAGYIVTQLGGSSWLWSGNTGPNTSGATQGDTLPGNTSGISSGTTYDLQMYGWVPGPASNVIGPAVHCYFVADTSVPGAPTFQSATVGGVTTTSLTNNAVTGGVVGQPMTITFNAPPASDNVVAVRYSWNTLPVSSGRVQISPCSGTFNSTDPSAPGVVGYACVSGSSPVSITVAPPQDGANNQLNVEYVNQAQTASAPAVTSGTNFFVTGTDDQTGGWLNAPPPPKPAAIKLPSHVWSAALGAGSTIADGGNVTVTGHAGPDSPAALTLASGVGVVAPAGNPSGSSLATPTGAALQFSGPYTGTYNNSASVATVAPGSGLTVPYQGQTGFTVGAWVYPTTAGNQFHHAILSQEGTDNSGFVLRTSYESSPSTPSTWEFCMFDSASTSPSAWCVDSTATVALNQWTFVVGIWDPVNHEIRVEPFAANAASSPVPVTASVAYAPTPSAVATGAFTVGRAQWTPLGGDYDAFDGQIASPFMATGVMANDQLDAQYQRSSQ